MVFRQLECFENSVLAFSENSRNISAIMKKNAGQFCWSRYAGVWMLTCAFASPALASNTWTNLASGLWRDTNNWSSHKAPDVSSGAILITTNTSKVITIDSLTPSNNLTINNLTLSAPENSTNTLALSDVGTNAPLVLLTTSDTLSLRKGGALTVTNSALVITGSFLSFNLWAGSAVLESGSIVVRDQPAKTNTTVFTRIGRTNAASLTINGGTMEASALLIGESPGSQFPRSDGTVTINGGTLRILSDLSIGDAPTCTGTVAVAGGQLLVANNLTNVIRIGNYGLGQMI